MQTQKMSLANIKGKLSRAEMKNIMAGSGAAGCNSSCNNTCTQSDGRSGTCHANSAAKCFCVSVY